MTSFIEVKVPNVRSQCRQSRTETRIDIGITCVKSVKIGGVVIGTARSVCATARRPSASPLLQLQVCCCVPARRAGWRCRPLALFYRSYTPNIPPSVHNDVRHYKGYRSESVSARRDSCTIYSAKSFPVFLMLISTSQIVTKIVLLTCILTALLMHVQH